MIGNRGSLLAASGSGTTFGEKFPDPAVLPTGIPTGVAFSPTGDAVVVTHATSPFITAYRWSSSGFGAKYANPTVLSANAFAVDFTPSGSHVIISSGSTLVAYEWSSTTGFGTRQQTASFGSNVLTVRVSPSGEHIAINSANLLTLVPWTGTAFGGSYVTPASGDYGTSLRVVDFSPDGSFVGAVGVGGGIAVYPFFSGVLGSPYRASTGNVYGLDFNNAGSYLVWGGENGRALEIAAWSSSGFGAAVTTPSPSSFPGSPLSVCFSPLNSLLAVGLTSNTSPLYVYRWLGNALGSRFADPLTLPVGRVNGGRTMAFSPSGDALFVTHNSAPYVTAYKIFVDP